jgi:hypothetical protein
MDGHAKGGGAISAYDHFQYLLGFLISDMAQCRRDEDPDHFPWGWGTST